MTDNTKPVLTSLSFRSAIDVSIGSRSLTFTATGSDDASGIADLIIYFSKPISYAFSPTSSPSSFSLFIADGSYPDTWADGRTATTFTISPFNAPGVYTIDHVTLSDHVGNTQTYSAADLSALGSPSSLTITGGQADTNAPALTSFSFNSAIDVSGGGKPLTLPRLARTTLLELPI